MLNLNKIIQNLNVSNSNYIENTNDLSWDVLAILSAKLIECVFLDDIDNAKKLLAKGADILTDTALYYLEEADNYAKIEAGPDSNPYSAVIQSGSLEMVDLFLSSEPDLAKKNKYFFYPVITSDRVEVLPILAKYNLFDEDKIVDLLRSCVLHSKDNNQVLFTLLQNDEIKQIFYDNTKVICDTFISNNLNINSQNCFLSWDKYKETTQYKKVLCNYDIISEYANPEVIQTMVLGKILECFQLSNLVDKSKQPNKQELNQFLSKFFNNNNQANVEIFYHHIHTICQTSQLDMYTPFKKYQHVLDLSSQLSKYPEEQREQLAAFKSDYSIYKLIVQALSETQMIEYEKAILNSTVIEADNKKSNHKMKI